MLESFYAQVTILKEEVKRLMSNLSLSKKKVEVVKNDVEDNNSFHQVVMDHLVRKKEK